VFDLVVRGGQVVDGTGRAPFEADVAMEGGRIVAVGEIQARGTEEIDARGRIVTPGFVDIHTHYDGHAVWAERLNPSSYHGVTTSVMGNCGVGFAPCRPSDRDRLVSLMEGVEDIPEVVLTAGLTWDWESFPDYLNRLAERRYDMDVAAYLPHAPLRVFVMGERAAAREPATPDDVRQMQVLAREAMNAGAMGFSTSRTLNHRARDGWLTPSYAAGEDELTGIGQALREVGSGALQLISDFEAVDVEFDMLERVAAASRRPLWISLMQHAWEPERWRAVLDRIEQANARGVQIKAQVAPRPIGALLGLELFQHPFSRCPSYAPIADLSFEQRRLALADPELRARLIAEQPASIDGLRAKAWSLDNLFPMTDPPNYEPAPETSIAAVARARGTSPVEYAYDLLLEDGGKRIIYMPTSNYVGCSSDATRTMLHHDQTLVGLGDGGAHCSTICDASFPTYLMARWVGDRAGAFPLERAVQMLTADNAAAMGLTDRGQIRLGARADLNVIDLDHIGLHIPEMVYDLPMGQGRLRQRSRGYDATVVAGAVTYREGEATGVLPGRLVRGSAGPH